MRLNRIIIVRVLTMVLGWVWLAAYEVTYRGPHNVTIIEQPLVGYPRGFVRPWEVPSPTTVPTP